MYFIINILVFLVTVFILVTLHEYGHLITARWLGVKVKRFAIGFGRPIWSFYGRRSGIEYVVGYIPLGGYVKLLDEREAEVPSDETHLAFNRQSAWRRLTIILAGPVMNVVLAVLAYSMMFMIGLEVVKPVIGKVKPQSTAYEAGLKPKMEISHIDNVSTPHWQQAVFHIITRLGDRGTMVVTAHPYDQPQASQRYQLDLSDWRVDALQPNPLLALGVRPFRPHAPPVIHHIKEDSPAQQAGFQQNDRIVRINEQKIASWYDVIQYIRDHPRKQAKFVVKRQDQKLTLQTRIGVKDHWFAQDRGYMGLGHHRPEYPKGMIYDMQYGPLTSLVQGAGYAKEMISFNYILLAKIVTGDLSMGSLGGPISIFQASASAFSQGIAVYMNFLGLISIMLAILNTLPIPGLDGGHVLMIIIEKIIRRPVPISVQLLIYRLGFIALILLIIHATVNDLMRLV